MLQQLKQSDIAAATRASNVRVIDPARIPARPYKPDARMSAGLGLLTGVFLGIGFVVLRERGDRSIQQPGDTHLYLNLPELGVIPSAPGDRVGMITWREKPSLISESFRSTLLSIQLAKQADAGAQVLVVASAEPLEGKSTVASNLGIAMAETGKQVLLIDADLRKPKLHDVFGMANERGLSTFLSARGGGGFHGLIQDTKVPRLFVLTSGPGSGTATSLLHGPRMPELLRRLRTEFETI